MRLGTLLQALKSRAMDQRKCLYYRSGAYLRAEPRKMHAHPASPAACSRLSRT
jgi:hypothetical protein